MRLLILIFSLQISASIGFCAPAFSKSLAFQQQQPIATFAPDILWWSFTNGSGTTINSEVGANGTTDGTWATGKSGTGYSIETDGSSQEASTSSSVTYSTNILTISFWLWTDVVVGSYRVYLESGLTADTFSIYYDSSNARFTVYSRGTTGAREEGITHPANSAWNHILIVCDNSTATGDVIFYVNGVLTGSTIAANNKTGTANYSATTLYVAARTGSSLRHDGKLDDIRIYSGNQSASVTNIMNDPR